MFRTRLIVGSLLAILMLGALFLDDSLAPWHPLLAVLLLVLGIAGTIELAGLLPRERRPPIWLTGTGVAGAMLANWALPLHQAAPAVIPADPWKIVAGVCAATLMLAFIWEMAQYGKSGDAAARLAGVAFVMVYLAVLASFLAQLRWLPATPGDPRRATHALMLTVFVPKCCDIGAYCAGRLFGRRQMTPRLSPKKTWEGAVGGIVLAVLVACAGASMGARPAGWMPKAIGFGIALGAAGMLGDLAESLLKREGMKKDASAAVPGFGGVLDVVDSVLFAAPVAYFWLNCGALSPL